VFAFFQDNVSRISYRSTMLNELRDGERSVKTSDGARIFYRTVGQGPRTLLLLHGWGGTGSGAFWDPVVHQLDSRGLRMVLPDLRGHGRSDHTHQGFTTERFAEDLFEVADDARASELVVVGYSMSGRWAQWMACSRPDRVRGQILVAPAPAAALPLTEEMLDGWITATRARDTFTGFIRQFTKTMPSAEIVDEYFASVQASPEHALRESFRMCCHPGFADRLGSTRAATLVVGGLHDPMLAPDFLRQEVVQKIPGARLALVDSGHEIPIELPGELAALIEAFMAGAGAHGDGRTSIAL
jgi:pimeloyl-ACP methyl ester carboxylesterase